METKASKFKVNLAAKTNQPKTSCLGPVADLEQHLPQDWWRSLFNSVYLKTDADVVENKENTLKDIDLVLQHTGVKPEDHILDLCCGQGRHTLTLVEKGYPHVMGVDRSRYLIRLARRRAIEKGLSSTLFREGDARKVRFADSSFDLVMLMGNSFGYFEREEDNLGVLKEVYRLLKDGGKLFLDLTDGDWMRKNYAPRSWEWIDQRTLVCRERTLSEDRNRLINREVVIDAEKGIITDQFYADRLYNISELKTYLSQVGFENIELHGSVQSGSDRLNPDLGMMANRLIISAKITKKPVAALRNMLATQKKFHCTVLLGDPSLPDKVKLEGKFNSDDFNTVNKLKEALDTLDGYQFYFQDNHHKLLENIVRRPPSFIFNLCDEGFHNDAFKELHIPAVLEMYQIPYSGAGPACLAVCYNKGLVSAWANSLGIATPEEIWIDPENFSAAIPTEFPAFVKPVYGDSSIGITKDALIHNATELIDYCDWIRTILPGSPILVQEYLPGKEYSIALVGNPGSLTPLPILEVDFSRLPSDLPPILGYESKWMPDSPYCTNIKYVAAELSEELSRELFDSSALLFQRLGCHDYARFDFRLDQKGKPKLLEVNPNPGWCWDGKMNLMAEFAGWSYPQFLQKVIMAARERLGLL